MKRKDVFIGALLVTMAVALTGCKDDMSTETTEPVITIDPTEEIVVPDPIVRRTIPEEMPKATAAPEEPGSRKHFSFQLNDKTYVFTETENLWMYNQSKIREEDTQFMLDVNGYKVVIARPEDEPTLISREKAYEGEGVVIYRTGDPEKPDEVADDEQMFLTVYDTTYEVTLWNALVQKNQITSEDLYTALAQMGTAIKPAEGSDKVSSCLDGLAAYPVFGEYKLAYREGVAYSGYIFCSPNIGNAEYDNTEILMSAVVNDWDSYATVTIGAIPDYIDRLEDTGEKFGEYSIFVDYQGELKYYLICPEDVEEEPADQKASEDGGEEQKEEIPKKVDNVCVTLEAVPGNAGLYTDNYTAEEAAYIFELLFTK